METQIVVRIAAKGHLPGTLGWLQRQLEGAEITVTTTKGGSPAAFLAVGSAAEGADRESLMAACWDYFDTGSAEITAYPFERLNEGYVVCKATLTEAARDAFDLVVEKAVEALQAKIDADDED